MRERRDDAGRTAPGVVDLRSPRRRLAKRRSTRAMQCGAELRSRQVFGLAAMRLVRRAVFLLRVASQLHPVEGSGQCH